MKHYCTINRNLTIALLNDFTGYLTVHKTRLLGVLGQRVDKFLHLERKHFTTFDSFGEKLSNGSYTGVLKALKEKKVDLFGDPNPLLLYEDVAKISGANYEHSFKTGQVLRNKIANKSSTTSLEMFNLEIWLQLAPILTFLFTFMLLFKMVRVSNLHKRAKLIVLCLLEVDFKLSKSMNAASFIAIFYLIYLMIFKFILSTNIKTISVIVDTSDIVDNTDDLLRTKRIICYLSTGFEISLSKTAPKNSYLNYVLERSKEMNNHTLCTYSTKPSTFVALKPLSTLILLNEISLLVAAAAMSNILDDGFFYLSEKQFFKIISVIYFKKDIDPFFLNIPTMEFEHGLRDMLYDRDKINLKASFRFRIALITNKQQYIDEISESHSLNFNYIKVSFQIYFCSNLILICILTVDKLIRFKINR